MSAPDRFTREDPRRFPPGFHPTDSASGVSSAGAVRHGGALLERERELNATRDALDRAQGGDGALLLVQGPPGIGKTELVREARAAAAEPES